MTTQASTLDRIKAAGFAMGVYFTSTVVLLLTLGMVPNRIIPLPMKGLFILPFVILPFMATWKLVIRRFGPEAPWKNAVGGMTAGLGLAFPFSFALVGAQKTIPASTLIIIGCWAPTILTMAFASFIATYVKRDISFILFFSAPALGLLALTLLLAYS